ncbi:MAG: hypothetical protein CMN25_13480 [Salinicola sp.]|nr:hypothetical protein [Salinicola sp.]|tara:strand:- start:139 stop:1050 length:912 start_codon:yes stop_codon:yes gene_type:complete
MKPLLTLVAISSLALTACGQSSADPENQKAVDALIKKTKENLVYVKGGSFQMGDFGQVDPKANNLPYSFYDNNKVLHEVELDGFFISSRQVSYADYDVFKKSLGQPNINNEGPEAKYRAPDVPAGVDWYQAHDYCEWLSEKSGQAFSLPTEAQWEYAARNRGEFRPFATDDGTLKLGVNHSTSEERKEATSANDSLSPGVIASYPPNPLGIYQMGLNGFEWVSDWYDKEYYKKSTKINPSGPEDGLEKVRRGGELGSDGRDLLTVNRRHAKPDLSIDNNPVLSSEPLYPNTFRCVLNDGSVKW